MDLVRDFSDKLVLDRNGREIGRVDRVLLDMSGSPPRVVGFEIGPAVLATRLAPLLGRWVAGLERALGIDRDRPLRIHVGEIIDRSPHVRIDRLFADTPAGLVENKLQRRLPALAGGCMKDASGIRPHASTPMDRLLGRPVVDRDGRSIGRIHELRADVNGDDWTVTHFVVGVGGLLERLGVALKLIVGRSTSPYVVAVDQMELSDPRQARVRCARSELRRV